MKLSAIALKNLKHNRSFYALYLFSISFVWMIFFCFTSFSMNEVILEKISSDGRVETMSKAVSLLLMAFVVFYMSSSNKFFMRRRMKELGIYSLLGYRKTAMLRLLTMETAFLCAGGLTAGILTGSLLHKGLTAGITALLGLSVDTGKIPLLRAEAVLSSILFAAFILLALFFSNAKLLRNATLMDMVRLEKKPEKPIRVRSFPAVAGILSLSAAYLLAMDILRGKQSVWNTIGFSPIALLTLFLAVTGTALFIRSFLPFFCLKIERNKCLLYRDVTILTVPRLLHQIRSNSSALILLILLSAGTLCILGATFLSVWYPIKALDRIIPASAEYRIADDAQKDTSLDALEKALGNAGFASHETTLLKVTAQSGNLPEEYAISADKGRAPGFECISQEDYDALMALQGKKTVFSPLQEEECILIKYRPDDTRKDVGAVYTLYAGDRAAAKVSVKETSLQNPIGFGNSVGTLIVSHSVYRKLQSMQPETIRVMSIGAESGPSGKAAFLVLQKAMPDNRYLVSAWQRREELLRENSSTLLLVCFTTVIFMIAAGSILYFQNLSAVTYSLPDYEILRKMGCRDRMIRQVVCRQIQLCFLIPYMMGIVHSIFALICYKSALMDDLLGSDSAVVLPILFSILLFTAVYLIYYCLTVHSCCKTALQSA